MTNGHDNPGFTGNGVHNSNGLIISPFGNSEKSQKVAMYDSTAVSTLDNNNLADNEAQKKREAEELARKKKKKDEDFSIANIKLDEGEPFSGKFVNFSGEECT